MLTISPEVVKTKRKSNGCFTIRLRFTLNRKMKRINTSISATERDLTKDYRIKASSPIKRELDSLISAYYQKCSKLQLELNDYSIEDVISYLQGSNAKNNEIDFISFCRNWIASSSIKGAPNYTTAVNAFVRFIGKEFIDIKSITPELIERFQRFLDTERDERNAELLKNGKRVTSCRTSSLYLMSIKRLFNEARTTYNKRYNNTTLIPNNPFEGIKIPKQEATRKRALLPNIIKAIYKLPYHNTPKGTKGTCRYDLAKDCFILSFCLMGMNSADLFTATTMTDNSIVYYRKKTRDRRLDNAKMVVNIPNIIKPIIEKYRDNSGTRLFNFYQYYADEKGFNKAINKGLKEIGNLLGIEDLEYYAARHSWATIALNKCGIDKYTVHSALNHVDDSMKVTDIYIERDFVAENKANNKVIKYVLG